MMKTTTEMQLVPVAKLVPYPLMLKTLDRVVVNTNGKLSFIFQSGIKITV